MITLRPMANSASGDQAKARADDWSISSDHSPPELVEGKPVCSQAPRLRTFKGMCECG